MPHISVVHVLVNAIGKNASKVFRLPKFSRKVICFGPSDVLVGRVKSGALAPTASGLTEFSIRSTLHWSETIEYQVGFESLIADSLLTDHDSPIPWKRSGGCLRLC